MLQFFSPSRLVLHFLLSSSCFFSFLRYTRSIQNLSVPFHWYENNIFWKWISSIYQFFPSIPWTVGSFWIVNLNHFTHSSIIISISLTSHSQPRRNPGVMDAGWNDAKTWKASESGDFWKTRKKCAWWYFPFAIECCYLGTKLWIKDCE